MTTDHADRFRHGISSSRPICGRSTSSGATETAIRIRVGDDAFEYLVIDGKRAVLPRPGQVGNLGGMESGSTRQSTCASAPCAARSVRGDAGHPPGPGAHISGGGRVRHHGHAGRAPRSRGPGQGDSLSDDREPLCRRRIAAYNRWIADFCRDSGGRLIPIAHLSLGDPAAEELERAVADWAYSCARSRSRRHPVTTGSSPPRRTSTCRSRFIRRSSPPGGAFTIATTSSAGAVWYFDLFAGQGVQHAFATILPARRLPPVSPPARRRARVPGRLDRTAPTRSSPEPLSPRLSLEGPLFYLEAPVLHLGRPRLRAHHRRADAARRTSSGPATTRIPTIPAITWRSCVT